MSSYRSAFLVLAVIATCCASIFPYFQERLLGYQGLLVKVALGPILFVALIGICFWISKGSKHCWWLALLGPAAFGPLLLVLYTFVCWKIRGFAP